LYICVLVIVLSTAPGSIRTKFSWLVAAVSTRPPQGHYIHDPGSSTTNPGLYISDSGGSRIPGSLHWRQRVVARYPGRYIGVTGGATTPGALHFYTNTSHSFPYIWLSAGDWLLGVVKGVDVSSTSFLGGFRGWGLGLVVWMPLKEVVLIWLASRWREIAARILRGGTQTPRLSRESKTCLSLAGFKFSFSVLYLGFQAPA